jgi:dipeptidyl aminopeptidase/acylaminoacyl peptidase
VEVGLDFAEDGRRAYAESMPDGRTQIVIEDEGGRRLQEISEPGALLLSPRFGPEGTLAMLKRDAERCTVLILRESEQIAAARCTNRFNTTIDWSDDGRWIVYTASEDSHPSGRRGLMLLDPATGAERALSEPPDGSYTDYLPSFSPASDRVAFIRGALSPRHHVDLFVATVADGALERLTETAAMSGGAAWLDDSSLAFSSNHDGRWGLWRVGSDGQLTLIAPWAVRQLSVDRRDGSLGFTINDWDFGLLRLDLGIGGEPELLSPSTRSDKQPHAGARGVVFISDRSGHDEVWLHRDGELPRQLTQIDGPTLSWPRISPDGSTVAFVQDGHDTAIHLLDLARPGSVRTVTSTVASSTPAWMPDGALIGGCLVAGVWQLCRFDPNGETPLASRALFHPEVDQDGMIYATDGSGGIWRLAASGAPELVFSELPSQSTSTWTVAGGLLYFIALGDAELTGGLHRVDLATGEATLVRSLDSAAMVNGSLSVTPDGMVYYARLDAQNDDILILPPTTD